MILDPAAFHLVKARAPLAWKDDVVAYLYQEILIPRADVVGAAPVPAAAPAQPESLAAKIAAIKASQPPFPTMPAAAWAAEQDRQIEAVRELHRARGDPGAVVGAGGAADPFVLMLDALRKEVDELESVHEASFQAYMASKVCAHVSCRSPVPLVNLSVPADALQVSVWR